MKVRVNIAKMFYTGTQFVMECTTMLLSDKRHSMQQQEIQEQDSLEWIDNFNSSTHQVNCIGEKICTNVLTRP